jgi:hypothetical protein
MNEQTPSMMKPALIAGAAFGVAAAIPLLNMLNCLCCSLIIGCGLLAAFLQSKQHEEVGLPFKAGDGALVGLVSGLVYGVVSGVLSAIIQLAFGMGNFNEVIQGIESSGADIDPATLEQITSFMESSGPAVLALIGIFFAILFGAIFATLGGLIGGALFKKEGTPPPTMATPPPPAPLV